MSVGNARSARATLACALGIAVGLWAGAAAALAVTLPAAAAVAAHADHRAARRAAHHADPDPGPAPAAAAGSPALTLLHQSPWVAPADQTFGLELAVAKGTPGDDEVVVTLYGRLHTRTAFEDSLATTPTDLLSRTHAVTWSTLPADPHGGSTLSIAVIDTTTVTPAPASGAPSLSLGCTPGEGECTGVYPVVVELERAGGGVVGRFTTYLVYAGAVSQDPLHVAWVVPIAAPVVVRPGTHPPADALTPPSTAEVDRLVGLVDALTARTHSAVALSVEAAPQTLAALEASGAAGRAALKALAAYSDDGSVHQFLAQPYVPIDLGALAGAGEGGEIHAQFAKGAAVLDALHVETEPHTGGPWVATARVGSATGKGMKMIGATQAVVPGDQLVPVTRASGLTYSSTFTLGLGKGRTVPAAEADAELTAQFSADPDDPALAADQLLADLAMIHYESPNTPTPRGEVALPPANWTPSAAFDDELLAGLDGNPNVAPVTLSDYFSTVPTTGSRRLTSGGTGPVLSKSLAHDISTARLRLTGFDTATAVGRRPPLPVLGQLDDLLLATETDTVGSSTHAAGIGAFDRSLGTQLSFVSLATEGTITLTARTGKIPITVVSSAPYRITGVLGVSSDRFVFPDGTSQAMTLVRHATSVRIEVQARTSGDLPMDVTFTSPTGKLVIAHGVLTVRSTATSVVGVVLTALALAVLLLWWARTVVSGRRRRRGHGRGGRGGGRGAGGAADDGADTPAEPGIPVVTGPP